jgi:SAM-dependent methyltransferase
MGIVGPLVNLNLMRHFFSSLLAHPITKGMDTDDPRTTELRLRIVQSKPFLRKIYDEWYGMIQSRIPAGEGGILELGSGAGYLNRLIPRLIRSEVFLCHNVDLVADARRLPFTARSLKAIVMTDVFHHIPDVDAFLCEAVRCLRPGGRIVMIEPWVTTWAEFVFGRLHHEPFLPRAEEWRIPPAGPLSGANGALPWIVLVRDRGRFLAQFPAFRIEEIRPIMPFSYLVSGGVSLRRLMPGFSYFAWRGLERALDPWRDRLAMFAVIGLLRI